MTQFGGYNMPRKLTQAQPRPKKKDTKNTAKRPKAPTMRACSICHAHEVVWTMQPNGPGEDIVFTTPGSHYRGFMAVNVCDECHNAVNRGDRVDFDYQKVPYRIENCQLRLRG